MKKSILRWLNQQTKEGKKLSIRWEGGGDSGWAYFEIDEETVENEYTEALVGYMYDHLDYGSWAGEFQASGEAIYNSKTRCFEGVDHYGEDAYTSVGSDITISVPKSFWFDTFHVEVECYYDESPNVSTRFIIKNGFLTKQHEDFCSNLEEVLRDDFEAIFSNYESVHSEEFRGCSDSWIFDKSEAIEKDDMLVFNIKQIEVQTIDSHEKSICLEIDDDFVERIDESLNEQHAD